MRRSEGCGKWCGTHPKKTRNLSLGIQCHILPPSQVRYDWTLQAYIHSVQSSFGKVLGSLGYINPQEDHGPDFNPSNNGT